MAGKKRQYKNPPIVEAIFDLRLIPDASWDLTIPGLIYERVKKEGFPMKEKRVIQELELVSNGRPARVSKKELAVFLTEDRRTFMQVGSDIPRLIVNHLRPYQGWEVLQPQINAAVNALGDIVEMKKIQRVGLRYINRIEILKKPPINMGDYFKFALSLGDKLPTETADFIVGCVFPFEDRQDLCKVELTSAVSKNSDASSFLLDIDYFIAQPREFTSPDLLEWIENAHQRITREIFEGCITDRLREIFVEMK